MHGHIGANSGGRDGLDAVFVVVVPRFTKGDLMGTGSIQTKGLPDRCGIVATHLIKKGTGGLRSGMNVENDPLCIGMQGDRKMDTSIRVRRSTAIVLPRCVRTDPGGVGVATQVGVKMRNRGITIDLGIQV